MVVSIFGDQPGNGVLVGNTGTGIHLPYSEMNEELLSRAVEETLTNPNYASKSKYYGEILTDQMAPPLEKAAWWVEYAIRHKNLDHLRTLGHDMPWYQLHLIDVYLFLSLVAFTAGYVGLKLLKLAVKRKSNVDIDAKKKRK